jgi:hypothetical protein
MKESNDTRPRDAGHCAYIVGFWQLEYTISSGSFTRPTSWQLFVTFHVPFSANGASGRSSQASSATLPWLLHLPKWIGIHRGNDILVRGRHPSRDEIVISLQAEDWRK